MKTSPFVHLHVHTCFSLLDGACRINPLIETVAAHKMKAVAITDHGVMYGIIDFYKAARKMDVKPVLGCEAYMAAESRLDRKADGAKAPIFHLVLLAENDEGYSNLMRLISAAHLEGFYYKPRIDKEILSRYSRGLIGLSACLKGEVTSQLLLNDPKKALQTAGVYADILGKDNFFLEIQDHGLPEQKRVNPLIAETAKKAGLRTVATNDVHYLKKEHAAAHDVLLCLQTQAVLSDPNRMRYHSDQFYLKDAAEMERLFQDYPGALDITTEIADRCTVELKFNERHFPTYPVPDGSPQKDYLIRLTLEGIRRRYNLADPEQPKNDEERRILDRVRMELGIIEKTGYINYFLVVWDFIHYARSQGIPVGPGRGSGGGSVVAYALAITDIEPLRFGLFFERFLNPERVTAPDFDIDFCQTRRGEVIKYVKQKYGQAAVAQITTFGSLGAKTVIRDVGRVLEIPYAKCDQWSKMVPDDPKTTLESALKDSPEFKKARETDPDCSRVLDFAFVLEGLYRNPGTHAAGVVIGEKPLVEIIPLARDKDGEPVTQFTMEPLGEIGLLKMDFLGLRTLTVLQEAVDLIRKHHNVTIDLDALPENDPATLELFSRGDTIGVFQLESPGMRDLIRRVHVDKIEDLIAMIALYRPGPMTMLDDYVNRKTGREKVIYAHPKLEPILKETYGCMLYQEQVQQAAHSLAGYSLGQGDILRRAMSKKKPEEMEKQREKFVAGCAQVSKMDRDLAGRIFDTIAQFAGYGFNKSHSTAYAVIAYRTAYLKAHYPAEFMCALISSEIGNFDKLPVFVAEASAMNLAILPPEVNASGVRFQPEGRGIRYGLAGVKNVGEKATEDLVAEREKNGPYKSLTDLCQRLDNQVLNKKTLESLIRCGAFDSIDRNRARLFNAIDIAVSRASSAARDRRSGQGNLFALLEASPATAATPSAELPECEAWSESVQLAAEKELLGIYLSGHPLAQHAAMLQRYRLATILELNELPDRAPTRIAGIVSSFSQKFTKNKDPMALAQIEDTEGSVRVVVFPEAYKTYGPTLVQDRTVLVCGEVQREEDKVSLIVQEIHPLQDAPRLFARRISLHVPAAGLQPERLERIRTLLSQFPGATPVFICLIYPTGEKVLLDTAAAYQCTPDEALIHQLEQELGEKTVYVTVDRNPFKNAHKPRPGKRFNGQR